MLVELPCGILHGDIVYDRVVVKPLTGRQQNYLIDMDLVAGNIGHLPKLLEDLAVQYQTAEGLPLNMPSKDAIWQIPSEDVELILLKIREATFGSVYALPTVCPHCSKQQMKRIDLDKLDIAKLKDKRVRTKVLALPMSNKEVEVKLIYLKDLFTLFKNFSEKKSSLFTATLAVSVKRIDTKEGITDDDLLDIPAPDLDLIEKAYMELRAELDTSITNECDGCEKEYTSRLPVTDPSFFIQSTTPSI